MKKLAILFIALIFVACTSPQSKTQTPEFTYKTYSNEDFQFSFEYPSEMTVESDDYSGIKLEYPKKNILLGVHYTDIIDDEGNELDLKGAYRQDLKAENVKHTTNDFHGDYYFLKGRIDKYTLFMRYTINSDNGFYIIEIQYVGKENTPLSEAIIAHAKKSFKPIK